MKPSSQALGGIDAMPDLPLLAYHNLTTQGLMLFDAELFARPGAKGNLSAVA